MVYISTSKGMATATKVKVSLESSEAAKRVNAREIDGVGLLRFEIKDNENFEDLTKSVEHPLGMVADLFYPKPVWYRIGHKSPLLDAQLTAVKALNWRGYKNINLILSLSLHIDEIRKAKEQADKIGLDLKKINLGVAIETPAAAMLIPEIAKTRVKFVCIDTDSLTKHILVHEEANSFLRELHPAVLKIIEQVVTEASENGISVSIYGKACSNPSMVEKFVSLGVNIISVDPKDAGVIKYTVAKAEKRISLGPIKDGLKRMR